MGVLPKNIFLLNVLLLLGTIECQMRNHTTSTQKNRKFKRDYSYNSYNGDPIDSSHNSNNFGYQPDDSRWNSDYFTDHYPFLFPPGTKITLTPAISIPITGETSVMPPFEFGTRLDASFPLTFTIKEMKIRKQSMVRKKGFLDAFTNPFSSIFASNQIVPQEKRILSRKSRDVGWAHHKLTNTIRCQSRSFLDRRTILQKMEMFVSTLLESGRDHPKMCLLRWACELHENSGMAGYYGGLLGEAAMLVFSVQKLSKGCERITNPHLEYLLPYIKAEMAGKSRNCETFKQKCSQSIFAG